MVCTKAHLTGIRSRKEKNYPDQQTLVKKNRITPGACLPPVPFVPALRFFVVFVGGMHHGKGYKE